MIKKTEAIVLRILPFSKTSHIVSWLTAEHGKIVTIIKGACRPKSMFLGQYDLFYTCELLYYTKEHKGLHIARECTPVNTRRALRTNWKSCSCASYVCDLMWRVSMTGGHQQELYELTVLSLDFLCKNSAKPQFLLWFELRFLKALGLSPQLMKCAVCSRVLQNSSHSVFSCAKGGILCPDCARSFRPPSYSPKPWQKQKYSDTAVNVPPDILSMLRSWQNADSPRLANSTKGASNQLLALQKILGIFLVFHLAIMPDSRNFAFKITTKGETQ